MSNNLWLIWKKNIPEIIPIYEIVDLSPDDWKQEEEHTLEIKRIFPITLEKNIVLNLSCEGGNISSNIELTDDGTENWKNNIKVTANTDKIEIDVTSLNTIEVENFIKENIIKETLVSLTIECDSGIDYIIINSKYNNGVKFTAVNPGISEIYQELNNLVKDETVTYRYYINDDYVDGGREKSGSEIMKYNSNSIQLNNFNDLVRKEVSLWIYGPYNSIASATYNIKGSKYIGNFQRDSDDEDVGSVWYAEVYEAKGLDVEYTINPKNGYKLDKVSGTVSFTGNKYNEIIYVKLLKTDLYVNFNETVEYVIIGGQRITGNGTIQVPKIQSLEYSIKLKKYFGGNTITGYINTINEDYFDTMELGADVERVEADFTISITQGSTDGIKVDYHWLWDISGKGDLKTGYMAIDDESDGYDYYVSDNLNPKVGLGTDITYEIIPKPGYEFEKLKDTIFLENRYMNLKIDAIKTPS